MITEVASVPGLHS